MKNLVILGSTGSIGESTLEVVRKSLGTPDELRVVGLAANSNGEKLEAQAREFSTKFKILGQNPDAEKQIADLVTSPEVDTVVIAIVGFAALRPTLAAIRAGKRVALANKEALVTCGELLTSEAAKTGAQIIPVDSEHNSLFQALQGHDIQSVEKLWITGSGGPFRGRKREALSEVSVQQALQHPTWKMGPKITIDSATLMNKGLEFIEARWIFDVEPRKIEVVIHPQSIVHGIVEFIDGTMLAHLAVPDMKAAISYSLYYPRRQKHAVKTLDLRTVKKLEFEAVDQDSFPCLGLAQEALRKGGVNPTALNAANEVAVQAFLEGRIGFLRISDLIENTLALTPKEVANLDSVFDIDQWARAKALEMIDL